MKRFQLCASVTAVMFAVAVGGSVQAGDKPNGRQSGGGQGATQRVGTTSNALLAGQTGGVANNLKKQGNTTQQNQLNVASNLKNKKIDAGQLMKKNNGSQGDKQQIAKKMNDGKKDQHFKGIKERCYFGKDNYFWSEHCWNDKFGCETYFCPIRHCWYFWYEQYACYLPCEYWATYCEPVVEVSQPVVEVAQPAVEVAQPVVEVQPVPVRYIVRPYVVYYGSGFGYYGPSFRHYVRY